MLEFQEISDFFADMPLEEEQMEKVLEYLDQNNVDVLRITDDDDVDDEEIILTDDDEVDVENIDLSVPEGGRENVRGVRQWTVPAGGNHQYV